jgi:hypothetical protein
MADTASAFLAKRPALQYLARCDGGFKTQKGYHAPSRARTDTFKADIDILESIDPGVRNLTAQKSDL